MAPFLKNNINKIQEKVLTAEQLFIEGDIFSTSTSELTEYIQALLCYNARTEDAQSKYRDYAKTLTEVLKTKTTIKLTRWLIAVAIITCFVGIVQIFVAYHQIPPNNLPQGQQVQITQELSKQVNVLNNEKPSIHPRQLLK